VPEVLKAPSADGTSPGTVSIEVDGTSPRPGDDARGLLLDWVTRGTGISASASAALSDATPAPESLGAVGSGVSWLLLPGSPSLLPPPIDWRPVEDSATFACSQVTDTERMLQETMASVCRDILHPIWDSLKKERKLCVSVSCFLQVSLVPPVFASAKPVSG
jgi:hypothetical protein